ncbi:hypothetical protein MKK68_20840 [Methylobacterium sp. E-016]|uniref:DUF6941 family protein n=1 Tax=Methylobacterium sp. E-016 TaxID=2836556 RepID=UPI001FBAEFCE|nr:hypothetical protein [Methylobacterium sp. E-016]MCJ2078061.1 hypothetical protein [Methylobacterium sp. E-016]
MSRAFTVDMMCICEYATQDVTGRAMLAGIFPGTIGFESQPTVWPQNFISIFISPKNKKFSFSIKLLDKDKHNIITFNGNYENAVEPDARERIVFMGQIPPVKFTGAGDHELVVMQGKHVVETRTFPVTIGSQLPMQLGNISITHEMNDID